MDSYNIFMLILPAILLWIIWLIWTVFFSKKEKTARHIAFQTMTYAYIVFVLCFLIFPIHPDEMSSIPIFNLVPFKTIANQITSGPTPDIIKSIAQNIIIFIPFGFLISFLFKKKAFLKCTLSSLIFSVIIELTQFSIGKLLLQAPYASVDIDDCILNILGAIIGYLIFLAIPNSLKGDKHYYSNKEKIMVYRPEIVLKKKP